MSLNRDLLIELVNHSLKTKKEYKNSKKQEIPDIFTIKKQIKFLSHVTYDNAYEDFIDLPIKTASDKV